MQQVHSQSASGGQSTGALNSITYCSWKKDPSTTTVHIQGTVECVEREATLNPHPGSNPQVL
eukprot:65724-Amphidinium_carterae.1